MIRADQLAASFDVLAGNKVRERDHPSADAIARLDDGDLVTGTRQLVRGGEAAESRADDDHATRAGAERRGEALGNQQRRACSERALQHFTPGDATGLAVTGLQVSVDV